MQKKFLALAVAAAISAPAFAADEATLSFYGKAFASLDNTKSDNVGANTSNSITTVHSNASRFGMKGEDNLGDNLKATYQYEAEFNLDGNNTVAAPVTGGGVAAGANANVSTAFLGTRNSKVGLATGFGEFFVGNWDTPYKLSHNPIELNDNTTFGSATNLVGRMAAAGTNLNTRLKDSFNYWSPVFSGFQVKLALGFDDAKSAPAPAGTGINQQVTAMSLTYENEMVYAALATQNHKDTIGLTNGAALGGKASGTRLVGEFKLGGKGFVGAMIENLKSTNAAGVDTTSRNIELSGKFAVTEKDTVGLSYVKAGSKSSAGATTVDSATQISLRYGHNFTKRTELYALYTSLKNGKGNVAGGGATQGANYNFSAGSGTSIAGSQPGATLSGLGVGMIVNF